MILNDRLIKEYCLAQNMIDPFEQQRVNPASYDLTLYGKIIEITPGGIMDASNTGNAAHRLTSQRELTLSYGQTYLLQPGVFILASSVEYIRLPHNLAGEVKLKSTTARKGIGHVYSGWIDPGFEGQITFELFSHVPVLLEPGKPIAQMIFAQMVEVPEKPYQGKYQYQLGPTPARQIELPGLNAMELKLPVMGTVMSPGIDQIWADSDGNVHVKTPAGIEHVLNKKYLAESGSIQEAVSEFVASILAEDNVNVDVVIEAIREDFDPITLDTWHQRPRPRVDRDWSEEGDI